MVKKSKQELHREALTDEKPGKFIQSLLCAVYANKPYGEKSKRQPPNVGLPPGDGLPPPDDCLLFDDGQQPDDCLSSNVDLLPVDCLSSNVDLPPVDGLSSNVDVQSTSSNVPPDVGDDEEMLTTVYQYSKYGGHRRVIYPLGQTTPWTVIITNCYYLKDPNKWETESERELKTNLSLDARLKMIFRHNTNADDAQKSKDHCGLHMGLYDQRKFSYQARINTTDNEGKISNALLVAFLDPNGSSGKYSTDRDADMNEVKELYWNCEAIDMTQVESRLIKNTKRRVFVSNKLQVNGKGFVKNRRVAFYRVGDWLTEEEINRAVSVCSKMMHALPVFLAICCSHRLSEEYLSEKIGNHLDLKETNITDKEDHVQNAMTNASDFMKCLRRVVIENYHNFSIDNFKRCAWISWGLLHPSMDKMYEDTDGKRRRKYRSKARKRMRQEVDAYKNKDDDSLDRELGLLHNFLIMSITQSANDTSTERIFRRVAYNMSSLASFFEPLEKMHWGEFAEVYIEIARSEQNGLYTQRASTLLNILVVVHILCGGIVPSDYKSIMAFRDMHTKKTNITLGSVGTYVGIGKDTHVERLINACFRVMSTSYSADDILYVCQKMDSDPGEYFNDICGEIGQAYNDYYDGKGDKEVSKNKWEKWRLILGLVAQENNIFREIICLWLPKWEKE